MAARSRITVLLLLFLLSTEHSFAVTEDELEPLVKQLLSKYRVEDVFSLAVSIPLNQNQNKNQDQKQGANQIIQEVLHSDPADKVKNKMNAEVYVGSRVIAAKPGGGLHAESRVVDKFNRAKRQANKPTWFCKKVDNNGRVTLFGREGDGRNFALTKRDLLNEALELINRWDNRGLSGKSRSELITSSKLRLDNQGRINREKQQYYNLQIQINKQRNGRSTTVAQIIVPVDTSANYMRFAFRESLMDRVRVVLEVHDASTSTNNNGASTSTNNNGASTSTNNLPICDFH